VRLHRCQKAFATRGGSSFLKPAAKERLHFGGTVLPPTSSSSSAPRRWRHIMVSRVDYVALLRAQVLICLRIDWSQASPPRSSLWSNQTSIPPARKLVAMRSAAAASPEA
jgi:hypothetical protein